MGTTTKALCLLEHLTAAEPELGLSEIARRAKADKATTFRLLAELCKNGFLEQNPHSKLFRLGPALIRYANLREATFPAKRAASEHLDALVAQVRETAHVTQLQGHLLSPIHCQESLFYSTRVYIDPSEMLPLHATASGLAVLAFSDDTFVEQVLSGPLAQLTPATQTQAPALRAKIEKVRQTGFGSADGEFEVDVSSIAAPLFDGAGICNGAVSIACPSARLNAELRAQAQSALKVTSTAITQAWGGSAPARLRHLWQEYEDA